MSSSASQSTSGNVIQGDGSPSWIVPAIIVGGLVLLGLGWLMVRKKGN